MMETMKDEKGLSVITRRVPSGFAAEIYGFQPASTLLVLFIAVRF